MKAFKFLLILGLVLGVSAQAETSDSSIGQGRSIASVSSKKKKKHTPKKKKKASKKAAQKSKKQTKTAKSETAQPIGPAATDRTRGTLKTDISFDDNVLHGQYQMPDESLVKVENEKGLSDLLGARKHFKDRLSEASEQE